MIVTFCGHGEIYQRTKVRQWLEEVISQLIEAGATQFYSGGYGAFDDMVAGIVWAKKKNIRTRKISLFCHIWIRKLIKIGSMMSYIHHWKWHLAALQF